MNTDKQNTQTTIEYLIPCVMEYVSECPFCLSPIRVYPGNPWLKSNRSL